MWKYLLILVAVLYSLSPYDLLPDFILGWGWLDDLAVLVVLWQFYNRLKLKKPGAFQNTRNTGYQGTGPSDEAGAHQRVSRPDPYRVLGVSRTATPKDIKHAYRQLAGQYHPDKVSHLGEEFKELAEKRFKEIQEAYQKLTRK